MESQRPLYGFLLALSTAVLWGVLPVFLAIALQTMTSPTITGVRFLFASIVVGSWLSYKGALRGIFNCGGRFYWLLCIAALLLVANYVTNVLGLGYLSPETVQVLMQFAPLCLLLGGVVFYRERLSKMQVVGISILLVGLSLFFNKRLPEIIASQGDELIGIGIILFSAVVWAGYALIQKLLLRSASALSVNFMLYAIGGGVLLPVIDWQPVFALSADHLAILLFCCMNTVVAYGAFTESLRVWQAAKVSAVLALAPIFTFISTEIAHHVLPGELIQEDLGQLAYVGAGLVVCGSIISSLGRAK